MTPQCNIQNAGTDIFPRVPPWVARVHRQTLEDVAFMSGAALSALDVVLGRQDVPLTLLRARLALSAAEACVVLSGRPERAGELRDAVHFLRPGDLPGPAGEVYQCWRRAVGRPVSVKALHRALPMHPPEEIACWLDAGGGAPVTRAAKVLETVLSQNPQAVTAALTLADATLSQILGWTHLVPVFPTGLKHGDLHKRGGDLRLACHRAITASAVHTVRMATDLVPRVARLNAVVPRLRARGAIRAVEMFLTHDAVVPAALVSLNSDRAARRFCDRLVDLGVVREVSGRDTFRIYAV